MGVCGGGGVVGVMEVFIDFAMGGEMGGVMGGEMGGVMGGAMGGGGGHNYYSQIILCLNRLSHSVR